MKTRIGQVDDPLEREADRVADAVVSGRTIGPVAAAPLPAVQRKCAECEEEEAPTLRRKTAAGFSAESAAPLVAGSAAAAVEHGGNPLTPEQRAYFEPRFGRDLSAVRIHDGEPGARASLSIGARAFTIGNAIGFAPGEFRPGSQAVQGCSPTNLPMSFSKRVQAKG